jgi:peptide subunit release factor 1 (eRF1)
MLRFVIAIFIFMDVLKEKKQVVVSRKNKRSEVSKQDFEQMWQNAISGDEFVKRVHEHIDKLYAQKKP